VVDHTHPPAAELPDDAVVRNPLTNQEGPTSPAMSPVRILARARAKSQ
jgi:hypothetical protein